MRDSSLDEFLSGPDEGSGADASEHGTADEPGPEHLEPDADAEPDPDPDADAREESEPDVDADDADEDGEDGGEVEGPPPATDVDPARSTYAWSPDGAACAACGERVEERWESESGLVCVECKEW